MTTLFVLIVIQLAGILISVTVSYIIYTMERRKTYISSRYKVRIFQKQESWPWLIEYFQSYPDSQLRNDFPHLYKVAMATRRYREIELLRQKGAISERKYQKELNKILPLIDIKADLAFFTQE